MTKKLFVNGQHLIFSASKGSYLEACYCNQIVILNYSTYATLVQKLQSNNAYFWTSLQDVPEPVTHEEIL